MREILIPIGFIRVFSKEDYLHLKMSWFQIDELLSDSIHSPYDSDEHQKAIRRPACRVNSKRGARCAQHIESILRVALGVPSI